MTIRASGLSPRDTRGSACARASFDSSLRASPASCTNTRAPRCASARATTHPSPPLFPGPAYTATGSSRASGYARTVSVAAASPARCMSVRDGVPAAMAAESLAAASAAVVTRTSVIVRRARAATKDGGLGGRRGWLQCGSLV